MRRRRSAARSAATATPTGATGRITPSRPLGSGRASRARGGSPADGVLAEIVQRLLAKRWSPEQVAHELAGAVRRSAVALAVQGDDLPGDLRHGGRADAAGASSASPATAAGLQRRGRLTAMRMIDERPAEVAGPRPGRSLGGRSDHGRRQPVGDRHAGRAHHPVSDPAGVPGRRSRRTDRGPSGDHRRARERSGRAAADADLGSGQGARPAPADHRRDRHRACSSATHTRRGSAAATRT